MLERDSREQTVEAGLPIPATSAPVESNWGQPPASQFRWEVAGNRLFGQYLYMSGLVATNSAGDVHLHEISRQFSLASPEETASAGRLQLSEMTIDSEVNNMEWLALSERSFELWDNELDADYDAL
ncbi:MAG: hypothetical protein M8467_05315 [Anaerolineae bacterium]|nr:hypothetical protein [Anaerolineae bacterium]